jgi:hypothetical protein
MEGAHWAERQDEALVNAIRGQAHTGMARRRVMCIYFRMVIESVFLFLISLAALVARLVHKYANVAALDRGEYEREVEVRARNRSRVVVVVVVVVAVVVVAVAVAVAVVVVVVVVAAAVVAVVAGCCRCFVFCFLRLI